MAKLNLAKFFTQYKIFSQAKVSAYTVHVTFLLILPVSPCLCHRSSSGGSSESGVGEGVLSCAFSPDEKSVATATQNGAVRVCCSYCSNLYLVINVYLAVPAEAGIHTVASSYVLTVSKLTSTYM